MDKKTLIWVGIAAVAIYIWHNNSASPSTVQQAALTQLQTQGAAGTNVQLTTMPISTTLIAEPIA